MKYTITCSLFVLSLVYTTNLISGGDSNDNSRICFKTYVEKKRVIKKEFSRIFKEKFGIIPTDEILSEAIFNYGLLSSNNSNLLFYGQWTKKVDQAQIRLDQILAEKARRSIPG